MRVCDRGDTKSRNSRLIQLLTRRFRNTVDTISTFHLFYMHIILKNTLKERNIIGIIYLCRYLTFTFSIFDCQINGGACVSTTSPWMAALDALQTETTFR